MSAGSIKMAVGKATAPAKSTTNISSDLRNPWNVGGRQKKRVHTATKVRNIRQAIL
jgi:hypothetical protein